MNLHFVEKKETKNEKVKCNGGYCCIDGDVLRL